MYQLIDRYSKKKPLWLVNERYCIGSDKEQDICLASLAPQSAELLVDGDSVQLVCHMDDGVLVNNKEVRALTRLHHGDVIQLKESTFVIVDPKLDSASKKKEVKGLSESERRSQADTTEFRLVAHGAIDSDSIAITKPFVVGRAEECQLVISTARVSRRHAEIRIVRGKAELIDLESANGTCVNGYRVDRAFLAIGDEIDFSDSKYRFTNIRHAVEDIDKTTVRPVIPPKKVPRPKTVTADASKEMPAQSLMLHGEQGNAALKDKQEQPNNDARSKTSFKLLSIVIACLVIIVGVVFYAARRDFF